MFSALPDHEELWFAGEPGALYVFKVNRRPWPERDLFTPDHPEDAFDHFCRMLAAGHEVITGKNPQRRWRIGGIQIDSEQQTLTGKLGWEPVGRETIPLWDPENQDWVSESGRPHGGRIVPFALDGETRLLTVLRDPKTPPNTTAGVFEQILRDNERELPNPSTEWGVEPVLDSADFLSWLETLDTVQLVGFTARLPNPEPRARYKNLGARIQDLHATSYTETIRSNRPEGLVGVQDDREVREAIAMGENGLASLRGEGRRGDSTVRYSQRNRVATERLDEVPPSWDHVWGLMKVYLKGRLRRFMHQDQTAS
jgi:hypothetical protein